MPSPCTPTETRSVFIIVNIAARPLLGSPTIQPVESSKFIWQVADAFMPILCSMPATETPLDGPGVPASFGRNLGTRNSEMPFTPLGASGRRARTRWMTLLVRSWSPAEMKILEPVILYDPSACGSALVRSRPRSVPQCDSVRHIVPDHSALTILGR